MASFIEKITNPLKLASDAAEKMLKLNGILEYGDAIREMHENILTGLKEATAGEIERRALQERIDILEREVLNLKTKKANLDDYEPQTLPPGIHVYAPKASANVPGGPHYACKNCYERGIISRLDSGEMHNGLVKLSCSGCGAELKTGHYQRPEPVQTRSWVGARRRV